MDAVFEREDGELSDSDTNPLEDEPYIPISRPNLNMVRPRIVPSSIVSSDESVSSDSDSDSDFESRSKRPKLNVFPVIKNSNFNNMPGEKNKKKNNIWANVLQEEELTMEIGGVGLKKIISDRNVESYDYSLALKTKKENEDAFEAFEETEDDVPKKNQRKRRFYDMSKDDVKIKKKTLSKPRHLLDIDLKCDWTGEELGDTIATALFEQKPELIVRVVTVLGQQKALELYSETQKVEKEGGKLILNGTRRRTSGGVYLYLLRTMEGVSKGQLDQIFTEDKEEQHEWRKKKRANKRRNKKKSDEMQTPEEEGMNLKGLFSSDDPGGTKCPGSTPVSTPTVSDSEDILPNSRVRANSLVVPMKEVCEKAASEISFRDEAEKRQNAATQKLEENMDTC